MAFDDMRSCLHFLSVERALSIFTMSGFMFEIGHNRTSSICSRTNRGSHARVSDMPSLSPEYHIFLAGFGGGRRAHLSSHLAVNLDVLDCFLA